MSKLLKKDQVVEGFDYGALVVEQRIVVQQRAGEIRERLRRTARDIWEVGQKLSDVRAAPQTWAVRSLAECRVWLEPSNRLQLYQRL